MDLPVERALVGDVHGDIHRVSAVECRISERHGQCISLLEGHAVLQPEARRQEARDIAELGRQVDPGDPAAETPRHVARRAAEAAADIQDTVCRGDREKVRYVLGRLQAAAVELVVGSELLDGRLRRVDSIFAQIRLKPREQASL